MLLIGMAAAEGPADEPDRSVNVESDPEPKLATVSEYGRSRSDSGSGDGLRSGRIVGDGNGFARLGKSMTKQASAVFR